MNIEVSNIIKISGCTDSQKKALRDKYRVLNPEYITKQRLNKRLFGTPKYLEIAKVIGDDIILPHGIISELKAGVEITEKYSDFKSVEYNSTIELRDYQQKAIDLAISQGCGVLQLPCGAGKTMIGLGLIAQIGGRALWLTNKKELLQQAKDRAKEYFKCDKSYFGTITEGKENASKLTFATVQTLANKDLDDYKDYFDIVVVDECHHCVGTVKSMSQFDKVLSKLNCKYKFGLTATPKRDDGLEKAMYCILGKTCFELSKDDIAENFCPVTVGRVTAKYDDQGNEYIDDIDEITDVDGTLNPSKLGEFLSNNETRNKTIIGVLADLKGEPTLVLSARTKHLQNLKELYDDTVKGKSAYIDGKMTSKKATEERQKILDDMRNGNVDVLFATYTLAKEGLDIPILQNVMLAYPTKNETTITQSCGRV
ncbi:MAG: DEAD/DEAH box helicase family protein, partial [Alphaproteobacteria bacterium]|nr:DEAD/DEAH box helicase family protein [Alphaproteobacteria bacterium]